MRHLVIFGPTASGKSGLSDSLAALADLEGRQCKTILFDSMQVYREIPNITNQPRTRPAELVGTVSVLDEWSVSHHKDAAAGILNKLISHEVSQGTDRKKPAPILEAGTGMYLNALLLDVKMACKVAPEVRLQAERIVSAGDGSGPGENRSNPRRAVRSEELRLSGSPERGSIWKGSGGLAFEVAFVYVRPDRADLDRSIRERSCNIVASGLGEAQTLRDLSHSPSSPSKYSEGRENQENRISKTVMDSIGVRELVSVIQGDSNASEAEERIVIRTRQLARRQMRWFDKLISEVSGDPRLHSTVVLDEPTDDSRNSKDLKNTMHKLDDTIGWWTD